MLKTIKAKTIIMQIITMLIMVTIVFVLFVAFFDDYYFNRKLKTIKHLYEYLQEKDLQEKDLENYILKYSDPVIIRYRDQNIKFLIADENFQSIFQNKPTKAEEVENTDNGTSNANQSANKAEVDAKINTYIIKKKDEFKPEITLKNKKHRICGYGLITQKNKKYYVYIYETKTKMKIGFSYNKIFLLITGALAGLAGILVSFWVSHRISKPIKQIESAARQAIDNDFDVHINEKQEFQELSSLSKSINVMLAQIRDQMQTLEEEIEHKTIVEQKRRQFVNNVSHEMKTPLAIISSQVEILSLIDDEKKREEYCQSIIEETEKMSEMINDMIVAYSAQNDEENILLEETDIGEFVREICKKYSDLFEKNNLVLHQEYEENCKSKINRRYFSQAVDNYITNSVKHSQENGNVYVRVMENNDYVRIEVENQGPAISEEYKDKIWDMFFKGDEMETLNGQKGTGLGLYLVKSIVELHQGDCGFNNLNKGIVFWIEIPRI